MIKKNEGPELYFGLVGPVGTDLRRICKELDTALHTVGYKTKQVIVSDLFKTVPGFGDLKKLRDVDEYKRIKGLMEAGNTIRKIYEQGDAAAILVMKRLRELRKKINKEEYAQLERTAFIIKSLKHPQEVEAFRRVYGDSFFLISVYEPQHMRIENLASKIASGREKGISNKERQQAQDLDKIDQQEVLKKFGQNVTNTFHLADLFINQTKDPALQLLRFIKLLFDSPYITPKTDEYGMFHARAASLRSADLSRQVGAAIASKQGEIISVGCNEVPVAGGGAFWEGGDETRDNRDYKEGYDPSALNKKELVEEVLSELQSQGWLNKDLDGKTPQALASIALHSEEPSILSKKRISEILEFGRVVHAEMFAVTDAAKRGIAIRDATLYCTTFPCHNCARHIIASGIKRVVYIEPYPKSRTKELYKRIVRIDDDKNSDLNAVKFEPFIGIAPDIYFKLFQRKVRKNKRGLALPEDHLSSLPRLYDQASYLKIITSEQYMVKNLERKMNEKEIK